MPINIPDALPAKDILESEKIFAIEDKSAHRQRIRPLKIVILNLMPKKIETETQILRLISKSALQVDIDFMMVKNHVSKNTSQDHLVKFYTYFEKLKNNSLTLEDRKKLAYKAFSITGRYDALISSYFAGEVKDEYPEILNLTFQKEQTLRYGENPHQAGMLYSQPNAKNPILNYEQLNGKELSFNNINDLYGCLEVMREFKDSKEVVTVAVKHTNPCGVGIGKDALESYTKCYEADKVSIFGGIVGITSIVDAPTAKKMSEIFLEIVVAYDYTEEALEILRNKKNLRVLKLAKIESSLQPYDMKYLDGKLLIQDRNNKLTNKCEVVTKLNPTEKQLKDMIANLAEILS